MYEDCPARIMSKAIRARATEFLMFRPDPYWKELLERGPREAREERLKSRLSQ